MRVTFHEELTELEDSLQREGELVLRSLRATAQALAEEDAQLLAEHLEQRVVRADLDATLKFVDADHAVDDDVDASYFAIHEGIQSLLARQTPVASDLRLVLAILHVNLHLERAADYCTTIAKLSKLVRRTAGEPRILEALAEMSERAEEMIRVVVAPMGGSFGAKTFMRLEPITAALARKVREVLDRPQ